MTAKVLFLLGVQDNNLAVVNYHDGSFNCQLEGNTSLYAPLQPEGIKKDFFVVGGAQPVRRRVSFEEFVHSSDLLFNCVSDADSNAGVLRLLAERLPAFGKPVINDPARVQGTTRENLGVLAQGIEGLLVPRTIRIKAPDDAEDVFQALDLIGIRMPFILRKTGTHGGLSVVRVNCFGDLRQLHRIGYDGSDMYLSEYVDYVDNDGLYRKVRLVVVDGEVFARHRIVSNHWMVHAESRGVLMDARADLRSEEEQFLASFRERVGRRLLDAVLELYRRTGLDFMGVDCSLRPDCTLLVFEANSSMNIFAQNNPALFPYLEMVRGSIKRAMEAMILRRLSCLVAPGGQV